MKSLHPSTSDEKNRMPQQMLMVILVLTIALLILGCSPSRKFGAGELSKLGKIAVISHGEYRLFYVPSPSEEVKGEDKEIAQALETFLEWYPLADTVRHKFCTALTSHAGALNFVPETVLAKIEDTSLQEFLTWAKTNKIDTVIHLESVLEVSHVYRVHDMPLRYYPKVWTKAQIIRLKDDAILWSKRAWTHAMDGTDMGLPSRSPHGYVFDSNVLEPLIDKKIDFVVKALVKDLV